jgi:potassium efflux system protein
LAEREQLSKSLAGKGEDGTANRQVKLVDEMLETDRVEMMALKWMQTVIQYGIDAWSHRYVALGGGDAEARASAISALSALKAEADVRTPLVRELASAVQAAIDQQEMRLKDALLDGEAAARESAILETLKQRLQAVQRVELAGERLGRVLARWLGDFGFSGEAGRPRDWKLAVARGGEMLKEVWNFELFAVEDSTVVEGKTVTTAYGVTVGKSIGVLLLYVFTYWLCSLLSRQLERIMVRRFTVDEQLASVTRRWIMIAVSVVLLIVLVLNLARIPLTVFAFMGGALAIGVGFGTQTIIKNVISGIIILFERKVRVGDIIAIGGTTGYVTAVDLRASTVRSFDGVEALVPNSTFLENQVVNWTYSNSRIRREIRIGIAYGSPVRKAAEIIAACAEEHGQVHQGSRAGSPSRRFRRQRVADGPGLLGRSGPDHIGTPRRQRPAFHDREAPGGGRNFDSLPAARPAPQCHRHGAGARHAGLGRGSGSRRRTATGTSVSLPAFRAAAGRRK